MNKIQDVLLIGLITVLCFAQQVEAQTNLEVRFLIREGESINLPDALENDAFHEKLKELGLHPWHVFLGIIVLLMFEVLLCWVYSAFKKSSMKNISGHDLTSLRTQRSDSESSNSYEESTEAVQNSLSCGPLFLRNYSTY